MKIKAPKKILHTICRRFGAFGKACGLTAALALSIGTSQADLPEVLFSANSSEITADPLAWPATHSGGSVNLVTMGFPSTSNINGELWELNSEANATGFRYLGPGADGAFTSAIPVDGASIMVAVRPIRSGLTNNWQSVIDVFYNRLVLVVRNGDGAIGAWVNGVLSWSETQLPNGEIAILSLVVQADGSFKVFADGLEVLDNGGNGAFTALDPLWNDGGTGFWSYVNVGRNNPDGWTTFNGNIGDMAVYKGALETADREALEASLTSKYGTATVYTVTATAGAGGTIDPVGEVEVPQNSAQTFKISPEIGYELAEVVVDSESQGAITTYTFTEVTADHTINVTWNELPSISGTVIALATTDPIYSASISLSTNPDGRNPSLTFFTDASGNYLLPVPDSNLTYYLVARKGGKVASAVKTVAMTGSSATGENFALARSAGLDPLVELNASPLSTGTLNSWPNSGSLGGTFEAFNENSTPTVVANLAGLKAVEFTQPDGNAESRQTLVGTVSTPPEIAGASDWTISTVVYRSDANVTGENAYMCWSGRDIGGWPASQYRTAVFCDRDNLAAIHYGADYGFDLGPPPELAWHNITITYDGEVETLYLDGVFQQTRTWPLNLKSNTMMMVGSQYWDGNNNGFNRQEDQYWRFNGAIASMKIYDQALTEEEVISISGTSNSNDADADGLLDSWELSFPGIVDLTFLNGAADGPGPGVGTGDYDGDGSSDLTEQTLGLNPTNSGSRFAATIVRDAETGEVVVTWPSQVGLEFNVWRNDRLSAPLDTWLNLGSVTDTDGGSSESFTDTSASSEDISFYVIELK